MSTTRSPRRHVRARRRRIYRIRRVVVACACLLLVLGVTFSTRGSLRALNVLHAQAGSGIWSSAMSPYRAPEQTPTEDEHTRKQREEIAALEAPLTADARAEIYAKAKQTTRKA